MTYDSLYHFIVVNIAIFLVLCNIFLGYKIVRTVIEDIFKIYQRIYSYFWEKKYFK